MNRKKSQKKLFFSKTLEFLEHYLPDQVNELPRSKLRGIGEYESFSVNSYQAVGLL